MTGKLIGYFRSYGTFTPDRKPNDDKDPDPIEYDNITLQFLTEVENSQRDGCTIEGKRVKYSDVKMKLKYFHEKVGIPVNRVSELDDYIGKPFQWFFNEFGNIDRVDPL